MGNSTKISKSQADKAGKVLRKEESTIEEQNKALVTLGKWREMHNYPLVSIRNRLEKRAYKLDKRVIVAQRLKRASSIIKKLNRPYNNSKPTMTLSQMQDIAGCRAIFPLNETVQKFFYQKLFEKNMRHKSVRYRDYISNPKEDGYRSIHCIYEFRGSSNKQQYNGLFVEIQLRSKLQHIWATAVETIDLFTGQAIKSNKGEKEWMKFFVLVSSLFAQIEKTPLVPNTPRDVNELKKRIRLLEKELDVSNKMKGWAESIRIFEDIKTSQREVEYFLLELDTKLNKLTITGYPKNQKETALAEYSNAEKRIYADPKYDVVLVGVDKIKDLKRAYPNYYMDSKEFLKKLNSLLND